MTPERWGRIKEVFDVALETPEVERGVYIESACGEDAELRGEVERLLAESEKPSLPGTAASILERAAAELAPGDMLSHYSVQAKLGKGGMGAVYRAYDTRLDRQVALKVLPPEHFADPDRKQRLMREARAASALNHPNIVTVYEISSDRGVDFIAMEYVEGHSLAQLIPSEGLPVKRALGYAVEIADALAQSHAAGVIHRDLKPANIMVTGAGRVKLLDFGLARRVRLAGSETATLTMEGGIAGTPAYMSPEQACGKPVDQRTDIWAFGCTLYELLTGRPAFRGETAAETLAKVLEREPNWQALPPATPAKVRDLLQRCLQKDADRRLHDMADARIEMENALPDGIGQRGYEARDALEAIPSGDALPGWPFWKQAFSRRRWLALAAALTAVAAVVAALNIGALRGRLWGGAAAPIINSLAVLPFVSAGGAPDAEYLSAGISESLITGLSRVPRLKVKSRDTVFRYKGQDKDVQVVGRELGVRAVLKGRLVQRGDSLSISAELVDTSDGTLLWRDQYDRKVAGILAIEQEISKEICQQLRLRLTGQEQQRMAASSTRNPEAYRVYLQGRYHWNRRTEESLKKSTEYFRQAIEKDPGYALAWAGLGDSFLMLGAWSYMPPADAYPKARAAATRAIQMEETLAEPHTTLAYLKTLYEWDWAGAEREFRRAIELNPEYGTAHHWYAFYFLTMGSLPQALAEIQRAREVEPLSPVINAEVGYFYSFARRYDQALQESRKALEVDPTFQSAQILGRIYALQGKQTEARAELMQGLQRSQRGSIELALAGSAFAFLGQKEEAQNLLHELLERAQTRYVMPALPALVYGSLGEKDRAFEYFEKALQERSLVASWLRDPLLDPIRSDPRMLRLFQRMGLPAPGESSRIIHGHSPKPPVVAAQRATIRSSPASTSASSTITARCSISIR